MTSPTLDMAENTKFRESMSPKERAEWCAKNKVPLGWLLTSEGEWAEIKAEIARLRVAESEAMLVAESMQHQLDVLRGKVATAVVQLRGCAWSVADVAVREGYPSSSNGQRPGETCALVVYDLCEIADGLDELLAGGEAVEESGGGSYKRESRLGEAPTDETP